MSAEAKLTGWIESRPSGFSVQKIQLIAGDASPRRYFRVELAGRDGRDGRGSLIAAISPPTEKNPEFLQIRAVLEAAKVRVPHLIAADLEQGLLLLEDLGDQTLLPLLSSTTVDEWYKKALAMLVDIAAIDTSEVGVPSYDSDRLQTEMDLFPEWFVGRLLGQELSSSAHRAFSNLTALLIQSVLEQPRVLVHRDFHSRNLMALAGGSDTAGCGCDLATIDFQDAVVGPISYDPVSLLKDCYVRWSRERQLEWLEGHQQNLQDRGLMPVVTSETFVRWFDLMGLQRHLKVLGIFARLWLRDGKSGYLNDLPLVLAYTREALALYRRSEPAIAEFEEWFDDLIVPGCEHQSWFKAELGEEPTSSSPKNSP